MRRIAVLGGGVSGLAAALYLHDAAVQRRLDLEIAVFERSTRTGGCVQTLHEDGYTMELGPDSLLADKPAARELLRRLQLDDQLVPIREEYRGSLIVHHGKLRPIPSEFRFFSPTSISALIRSGIFSPAGIARAAIEPLVPARASSDDESVASFVARRFGREVLERLAQPLIGGIYSGDPQRMSMQATLPQFVEMERAHGSIVRAMTRARSNGLAPQLMSLRDGLQSIVDAMRAQIGPLVRVSCEVQTLARDGDGWHVGFTDGSRARADAVICALPAYAAARALRG
ncbi:MAG TPA: protoporphyrinogen oxidase, partial [Candidatus Baltobacteraceae bacterium]|nr:protoporphyrinogen oxidase [Candidatus Baltobacteraceae bacterium]